MYTSIIYASPRVHAQIAVFDYIDWCLAHGPGLNSLGMMMGNVTDISFLR